MLKNYLTIAVRNLLQQKTFAVINIFSLSLGMACCLLIMLFVRHELSYDQFHSKADDIYRVYAEKQKRTSGERPAFAYLPIPLGPTLEEQYPEIKRFARLAKETVIVHQGDKLFTESAVFGDPGMLHMFSFPLLQGDPETALQAPNALLIGEAMAVKYFGHTGVLGEKLRIQIGDDLKIVVITGIVAEIPANSSIRFDLLLPFDQSDLFAARGTVWSSWNSFLFVELTPGTAPADLAAKLVPFAEERFGDSRLYLQPLPEVHLNPAIIGGLEAAGDPLYAYILSGIALLVLAIAGINFMMLSVGRAGGRLKEIGMRKVLGAARSQLIRQFWAEALLMSLLSLLTGIFLAELFLPVFNQLVQKNLALTSFQNSHMILAVLAVIVAVGVIAGSYPGLILSRFKPVELFRGIFRTGDKQRTNRVLVVLQFALAIVLVVGTVAMTRQMAFLQSRNLGFKQDHIVVLENRAPDREAALNRLREALARHPEIVGTTGAQFSLTSGYHNIGFQYREEDYRALECRIDPYFLPTMDIPVIAGRNFSAEMSGDGETAVLVNEKFVEMLGFENPLGQTFTFRGVANMRIIGVVKDFHFQSLHEPIQPMVMHMNDMARLRATFVRVAPSQIRRALDILEAEWGKIVPDQPFGFSFLDENLSRQYANEQRWRDIVRYSGFFAILVACLGLFGLVALAVQERTKEVGIRKVLGASVAGITVLLSKDYVKLVVLANLLAWPAGWYAMNRWLENFAYRIEISWEIFALAGIFSLLIALLTVCFQAVRAALADPVTSLRYE